MRLSLQKVSVMDSYIVSNLQISEENMFVDIARQIIVENVKFET